MRSLLVLCTLVWSMLLVAGCTVPRDGGISQRRQADTATSKVAGAPPLQGVLGPTDQDQPSTPPARSKFPDLCPKEKRNRPDWPELERSKAEAKEAASRAPVAVSPALPAPSAAHVARQAEFQAVVDAQRANLEAMPAEERARSYAEMKQAFFGQE
jgi:hypothetical protein